MTSQTVMAPSPQQPLNRQGCEERTDNFGDGQIPWKTDIMRRHEWPHRTR